MENMRGQRLEEFKKRKVENKRRERTRNEYSESGDE
jgi:hypothetical protein